MPGGAPTIDAEAFETELRAMIDNAGERAEHRHVGHLQREPGRAPHGGATPTSSKNSTRRRLVNAGSGGRTDHRGGDVHDEHPYPAPRLYPHDGSRAFVLGEYGGIGLVVGDNNPWQAAGWGYTTVPDGEALEDRYAEYAEMIRDFKDNHGLAAAIYTQITDVEIEINGLLTYDRVLKVDPAWIAAANRFEWAGPSFGDVVPTSQERPQAWKYTFDEPVDGWTARDFDDADWKVGQAPFGDDASREVLPIATEWTSDDIWMRKEFTLYDLGDSDLDELFLSSTHDDDLRVYINGVLALDEPGARHTYETRRISADAREALDPDGINVLAVHCRETGGDQQVDVGIVLRSPNRGE